jgi:hypothetical protein
MENITLFISYSWKNAEIVDKITNQLSHVDINIIRDKTCLEFKDDLERFMKNIKYSDFSLILFSQEYLKSQNCMYEAIELLKLDNYKDKILPIILENTNIFDVDSCIDYAKFWKDRYNAAKSKLNTLDPEQWNTEDLRIITAIKNNILNFLCDIKKMNCAVLTQDNIQNVIDQITRVITVNHSTIPQSNNIKSINNKSNKTKMTIIGIGEEAMLPLDYLEIEDPLGISLISIFEDIVMDQNRKRTCYNEKSYGIIEREQMLQKIKCAEIVILVIDSTVSSSTITEIKNIIHNSSAMSFSIIVNPLQISTLNALSVKSNYFNYNEIGDYYCIIDSNKFYASKDLQLMRDVNKKIAKNIASMAMALYNLVYKNNGIMNVMLDDIKTTLKENKKFGFICDIYCYDDIPKRLTADIKQLKHLLYSFNYKFEYILLNITSGDKFSLTSMGEISSIFRDAASETANIIVGTSMNYSLNNNTVEIFAIVS